MYRSAADSTARIQTAPVLSFPHCRLRLQGPDEVSKKRVHPAALAHANRVARAQQAGVTLYGYKLFPDLTPGRAFMWGSILAAWTVGSVALASARALDIYSVWPPNTHRPCSAPPFCSVLSCSSTIPAISPE